ncbi:octanoyl-[acyl-carrier-protein]:protein N-octanoyltransferase LIPT2, mitochondrial [Latimeria chalumnae]|uniref:Octanoyl-[acyl-carrier-protein]:protein N-octanoyltransferase LIPT2, mitochondrial n=1 Tax=Latimeria chalumnae TaxID=7897 RepID=H3A1P6_LATCH|nr:PREDICTED: putative lipoyltransferase 2, mitochondrial [Latimeria chalumnae]XP_006013220.1 PREDICTED: putative lipoyltransferase 2, mitochondrial [Latimeria chalumnae]XP_014354494.1 PREDICTED: putative lipoyltransferase 2, mitochondrial [Latimeria chalumnae]XP_014354495.1 PREDICTED: putative lipoyltransferase 2, mitochondrial [Latimeria chalumnae]|eukprot:XP_006013219.1 PREDICTED: putative lipoyltransferase 2, mitochondrial [Latimeria chalumnae]
MTVMRPVIQVVNLGRIPYANALQVQCRYVRRHLDAPSAGAPSVPTDTLLLCEHNPVYTIGIRQAPYPPEEEERLTRLGAEFFRTSRGGLVTFHGPGQLVCYPILNLAHFKKSVRWYVCQLERTVIRLCGKFRIEASTSPDTGVWVRENKICAIGIHCGRYITSHGLALNCDTDLSWFRHIVPCGIMGKGVTSLSQELKRSITVAEATGPLLEAFGEQFNCSVTLNDDEATG